VSPPHAREQSNLLAEIVPCSCDAPESTESQRFVCDERHALVQRKHAPGM